MSHKSSKTLLVSDTSATAENPTRTHHVTVNGIMQEVVFKYGEMKELAYETGIKFLQDGFIIREPGSDNPMKRPAATDENVRIRIGADEIVASYDELTDSALKLRAAGKPDGEKFIVGEFSRESAIDFLKGAAEAEATAANDDELEIEESDGLVSDDSLLQPPQTAQVSPPKAPKTPKAKTPTPATNENAGPQEQFGPQLPPGFGVPPPPAPIAQQGTIENGGIAAATALPSAPAPIGEDAKT